MPPFTRSRTQEVIAYCASVTKLTASNLLEECTQCPICSVEIASFASIYLHRGCANVVCSSCFESNLSQELDYDICLICKGHLAEPFIENAIPNWPFTYTDIPLPASSNHSSSIDLCSPGHAVNSRASSDSIMAWSPILSPYNEFQSGFNRYPGAGAGPAYNTWVVLGNLSAAIDRLKQDLTEQRMIMSELRDRGFPNRENNNTRFPRQGNLNSQYQNKGNPRYQDNSNSGFQANTYLGYQNNNSFQPQTNPSFRREHDSDSGPWYNSPTHRNQDHSNPQKANSSNPTNGKDSSRRGPSPKDPRNHKNPSHKHRHQQQNTTGKPRGFYDEDLDPAFAHRHSNDNNSQPQPQHPQPHQHKHNRGPEGKQHPHKRSQNNNSSSSTTHNGSNHWQVPRQVPPVFTRQNRRHAPGRSAQRRRLKQRTWNGAGSPPNLNQNPRHA